LLYTPDAGRIPELNSFPTLSATQVNRLVTILVAGYGEEVSGFRSDCAGWKSIQDFLVDGRRSCVVLHSQIGQSLAHQELRDILGRWKITIPVSVIEAIRT
jgi:hypothetical protein